MGPERADFRLERAWGGRQMDGWMDGRMDKQKSPCALQDLPPCFLSLTIMQGRAMGIADHILPLGDLSELIRGQRGLIPGIRRLIWGLRGLI